MDGPIDLYPSDPTERIKNTKKWLQDRQIDPKYPKCAFNAPELRLNLKRRWPSKCRGAVNAWLLMFGANPGASPYTSVSGDDFSLSIGFPHPHHKYFTDKHGYWESIRCFVYSFFNGLGLDNEYALSLFHHANLKGKSSKSAPNIDILRTGATNASRIIKEVQPRVIIAEMNDVYKVLDENVLKVPEKDVISEGYIDFKWGTQTLWSPWKYFISKAGYNVLLIRTPQQPTRLKCEGLVKFSPKLLEHIYKYKIVRTNNEASNKTIGASLKGVRKLKDPEKQIVINYANYMKNREDGKKFKKDVEKVFEKVGGDVLCEEGPKRYRWIRIERNGITVARAHTLKNDYEVREYPRALNLL
jgi:hypothetical protein